MNGQVKVHVKDQYELNVQATVYVHVKANVQLKFMFKLSLKVTARSVVDGELRSIVTFKVGLRFWLMVMLK